MPSRGLLIPRPVRSAAARSSLPEFALRSPGCDAWNQSASTSRAATPPQAPERLPMAPLASAPAGRSARLAGHHRSVVWPPACHHQTDCRHSRALEAQASTKDRVSRALGSQSGTLQLATLPCPVGRRKRSSTAGGVGQTREALLASYSPSSNRKVSRPRDPFTEQWCPYKNECLP